MPLADVGGLLGHQVLGRLASRNGRAGRSTGSRCGPSRFPPPAGIATWACMSTVRLFGRASRPGLPRLRAAVGSYLFQMSAMCLTVLKGSFQGSADAVAVGGAAFNRVGRIVGAGCDTSGRFRALARACYSLSKHFKVRNTISGRDVCYRTSISALCAIGCIADRLGGSSPRAANQHHGGGRPAAARDAAAADGERVLHSRGREADQGRQSQHQDQLEGSLRRLAAEADLRAQGRAGRHRRHRLRADDLPSGPAAARADFVHDAVRHQRRGDGRQGDRHAARDDPGIPGAVRQVRCDPARRIELRFLRAVHHLPGAEVRRHQGQEDLDRRCGAAMDARNAARRRCRAT